MTRGRREGRDRGVQYASTAYQTLLAAHGGRPRMSRRGDCCDNAVAERFFSTLKQELATRQWPTRTLAGRDVRDDIDGFYHPVRLHSTLGYQAPAGFEATRVMVAHRNSTRDLNVMTPSTKPDQVHF